MKPFCWDSINPFTGKPFTADDPNVHLEYYLEPGDPGFVPYPGQVIPKPHPDDEMLLICGDGVGI